MPDHDRMPHDDRPAEQFEDLRPHLTSVAYLLLGSRTEAEEAVGEAWIRLGRINPEEVDDLSAWLTTVTGRVCLSRLSSRTAPPRGPADPDLPPALDGLDPAERVSFVLREVFGLPLDQVATVLDRPTAVTRKLAERARRRVQEAREAGAATGYGPYGPRRPGPGAGPATAS